MQIRDSYISPFLVRDYPAPEMGCLRFWELLDGLQNEKKARTAA